MLDFLLKKWSNAVYFCVTTRKVLLPGKLWSKWFRISNIIDKCQIVLKKSLCKSSFSCYAEGSALLTETT